MTKTKKVNDTPLPDYEPLFRENADEIKKKPVKILVGILGSNWVRILLSTIFFIIKTCPVWISPVITANIINAVTRNDAHTVRDIIINGIVLAVILLQNIPTHILYARYTDRMMRTIGAGLRNTLIKKFQHLSLTFHKELESGKIQSKFIRDIEAIEFFNNHFVKSVIPAIMGILISAGISLSKSWEVTIFYAVVIPINIIAVNAFRKPMRENNYNLRRANENMSANVSTMIEMIPVTRLTVLKMRKLQSLSKTSELFAKKALS